MANFEQTLFPAFQIVLEKDVQEFAPYVFQIFSQLIETRQAPLPAVYVQSLFTPLLSPLLWERPGNVPALVRLLQAYLMRAGKEVVAGGYIQSVLGVFQRLVSAKSTDHHGMKILETLVDNVPLESLGNFLPTIWGILLFRLQNSSTTKYIKCFIGLCSLFVIRHGPLLLSDNLNKVQPGLFDMIVQQVWGPNIAKIAGEKEIKLCCLASTKVWILGLSLTGPRLLLCSASGVLVPAHLRRSFASAPSTPLRLPGRCGLSSLAASCSSWSARMMDRVRQAAELLEPVLSCLIFTGCPAENNVDEDEYGGYTASFAQLHNAGVVDKDPVPEVRDVRPGDCVLILSTPCHVMAALVSLVEGIGCEDLPCAVTCEGLRNIPRADWCVRLLFPVLALRCCLNADLYPSLRASHPTVSAGPGDAAGACKIHHKSGSANQIKKTEACVVCHVGSRIDPRNMAKGMISGQHVPRAVG